MGARPIGVVLTSQERATIARGIAQYLRDGKTATEYARDHDLRAMTCQQIAKELLKTLPIPGGDPREIRDAAFWQRKAKELQRGKDYAEHALRQIAGMAQRDTVVPEWSLPIPGAAKRAIGLIHLSDLHVGEVVRPEEIGGINAYDPDVFVRRFRRMIAAAIEILPRWSADSQLQGVVVAVNGDLVSGAIHQELAETNALTSHEQVALATDELIGGITKLADRFEHLLVTVTPGNHGRTTHKPTAKRIGALSYDTLIGTNIQRHFEADDRITVNVASGADLVFPIFRWVVLQTHGDNMGTGGGMGFGGPNFPIVRGGNKIKLAGFAVGEHYDLILSGHYHVTSNPGRILANGSVIGANEFSATRLRAEPETPQQWLGLIHERWGLRERLPVMLEDPTPPERPRLRVPAVMQ